jgi:endonuclease/exonuclease/phosphatase family metal-dependent hydrolase
LDLHAGLWDHRPCTSPTDQPIPLRLLSINCGGAASKLPRLVALLLHSDPDVVCLQEAGGLDADQLRGLPFRSWHTPPIRGGGLVTLVQLRVLHSPAQVTSPLIADHTLLVSFHTSPEFCVSVANTHLPPGLPSAHRRGICVDLQLHLLHCPPGARIIAGDLNDNLLPPSTWLRAAVAATGCWSGWSCPYTAGVPTNFVRSRCRVSAKELDWVLLSPDTACGLSSRVLLPGISTHAALQVDLQLTAAALRPGDPCGRRLLYRLAVPARLQHAAHLFALTSWWGRAAGLPPDDTIRMGHHHWDPSCNRNAPPGTDEPPSTESAPRWLATQQNKTKFFFFFAHRSPLSV